MPSEEAVAGGAAGAFSLSLDGRALVFASLLATIGGAVPGAGAGAGTAGAAGGAAVFSLGSSNFFWM